MDTYNAIRQLYPSFRLTTILKSIESTNNTIPEVAEDIYRKINGNIFMLSYDNNQYTLSTIVDITSPYLIKSYSADIDVPYIGRKVKYNIYQLHVEVFNALRSIYLRENSLNFPFFNSYIAEYWLRTIPLEEEEYSAEVHNRIMELRPDFDLSLMYRKIKLIYDHAQSPITFQLPEGITKVQFNGKEILFQTIQGDQIQPCNSATYDIVVSQLNLQSSLTIPLLDNLTTYHSTYRINA